MPKPHKTLIFDFAGVVTTSALFPRVADVFGKKSGVGKEKFLKMLKSEEKEYLLGNITTRKFWKSVCINTDISYKEFVKEISWYKINNDVLKLIKKLKGNYKVVLLSDNYDALLKTILNDKKLQNLFDYSFFSNSLHMVKYHDEEKIFRHVLKMINAKPERCIFIDDKEKNLIHAKIMGIHTILFKDINQLKKELKSCSIDLD